MANKEKPKIKKAISVDRILNKKFIDLPLEGKWEKAFGIPELSGIWIIYGLSGNGKTTFALLLAKYLTNFGKVVYNSLEEGARKSFTMALKRAKMQTVKKDFYILDRESFSDLKIRLKQHKSPKILFIDSLQYLGLTKAEIIDLQSEFPDKLFIFISHAKGKEPKGSVAEWLKYHSDVPIRIEGHKAFATSRYGGNEEFIIWPEGAAAYWGDIL